jgi:hypothetical protein
MIPHYVPKTYHKIAVMLLALCCTFAAAWAAYNYIYVPSPLHSIRMIARSIQDGDEQTFSEMVDSKALAGDIFDALAAQDSHTKGPQPVIQLTLAPLRSDFQANAQMYLSKLVSKSTDEDTFTTAKTGLDAQLAAFHFPLTLAGWHYVSTSNTAITGHETCQVDVTLHNDKIDKDIPCTFILKQIDKQRWRVIGVADFKTFIEKANMAVKDKLAAYNKPAQDKIDSQIKITGLQSELIHDPDNTRRAYLRLHYLPVLKTNANNVTEIKGIYRLRQAADQEPLYEATIAIAVQDTAKDAVPQVKQFLLNPLVPAQFAVIQLPSLDGYESSIQIIKIRFRDGAVWKIADTLPEQ